MVQNKPVIFACLLELKILSDMIGIFTRNSLLSITVRISFGKRIKIFLNLCLVECNARKQSEGSFGRELYVCHVIQILFDKILESFIMRENLVL